MASRYEDKKATGDFFDELSSFQIDFSVIAKH